MRVVITGAGGFVGNALAGRLRENRDVLGAPIGKLVLSDLARGAAGGYGEQSDFTEWQCGDLSDMGYLDALLAEAVDCIFHLASLPGAAAERSPERGRSVNLDAPLALAERLARQGRDKGRVPLIVFASTVAVYGPLGPGPVTEDQTPRPAISYGAHKLMTEILLADLSRRGEVDARSVRLPGIVARPPAQSGHGSAFMSQLFHKAAVGEPFVCPVSRDATAWWMSLDTCVANLIHAVWSSPDGMPSARVWQLPVLHASVGTVVAALARRFGERSVNRFRFEPDERVESLFGRLPFLSSPGSEAAGFIRDRDVDELVARVFG